MPQIPFALQWTIAENRLILLKNFTESRRLLPSCFTLESFEKLSKFKFLNKINSLEFWMIETEFDPISMCKFLKENFENDAKFFISFPFNFHHLKQQLIPPVKEIING